MSVSPEAQSHSKSSAGLLHDDHGGAPLGARKTDGDDAVDKGDDMSDSGLPVAGWYPAAHANGEQRYWDGAAWMEPTTPIATTVPPTPARRRLFAARDASAPAVSMPGSAGTGVPASTPEAAVAPTFFARPVKRRTGAIVAGATLVLGLVLGSAIGGTTAQSQTAALTAQVASLEVEIIDAAESVTDATADVKQATAELAEAKSEVAKAESDLAASTAEVNKMKDAATVAQTELDARATQIADLQGQVSAQAAPAPAPVPAQPAAPSATYYKNCSAARDAGAAPVRRGDPGYGSHLDRDGDGVGCE